MSDKKINRYWAEAKWLPTSVILEWCKSDPENFEARKNAVLSACQKGKIKYSYDESFMYAEEHYEDYSRTNFTTDFSEFLFEAGVLEVERISFSEWVASIVDEEQGCQAVCCDPKHPFHAKELKIAVEAWLELYERNPPLKKPKGGHIKYITDWLEDNYPSLGSNARKRVATIVNPNPGGGASPS